MYYAIGFRALTRYTLLDKCAISAITGKTAPTMNRYNLIKRVDQPLVLRQDGAKRFRQSGQH
jgi:hypothetical protein